MFTLEQAREMHGLWFEAYKAASTGKSYSIEGRTLTRQNLSEINRELQRWSDMINDLTGQRGAGRLKRVVLVDL